ncbi:MAG TPA: histidine phosphatase family protein [Desulfocapsa sulfexigens]|nr:histidine phosphatase family protein [Desulfocapsa sulfexigens]
MRRFLKQEFLSREQTILALLRHGKTEWNEKKLIQGRQDSPLSLSGKKQVHEWGVFLQDCTIDRIIASDLGRVQETVSILQKYNNQVPVIWKAALREQSWGQWEGKTFHQLEIEQPEKLAAQVKAGWDFCPPEGESRKEVLQRVLPVIQEVVEQFPGEQILIVSHEGIVKSLIYHLAGRAFLPEEKKLLEKRQLHLLIAMKEKLSLGPLNLLPTSGYKTK